MILIKIHFFSKMFKIVKILFFSNMSKIVIKSAGNYFRSKLFKNANVY